MIYVTDFNHQLHLIDLLKRSSDVARTKSCVKHRHVLVFKDMYIFSTTVKQFAISCKELNLSIFFSETEVLCKASCVSIQYLSSIYHQNPVLLVLAW